MNVLSFIYPFLIKLDVNFDVLKLKGAFTITIFNKFTIKLKVKIKNGYIYINHKNKQRKEELSNKNFRIVFIFNFVNQLYFRQQFLNITFGAAFGYVLDSRITAVGCGYIDVIAKSLLSKIKNNKKSSHIFTNIEPKYNEDALSLKLSNTVRISVFDIIYTFMYTVIRSWRKHEKI